jgi:mannose-6-phosphate isomerase-like protein (cupin superfamily)
VNYTIVNREDFTGGHDFEGLDKVDISLIWLEMEPGEGPPLHMHPYKEVFIILEGNSTFTIGTETVVARGGQVIIAAANVPHKFFNSGDGVLRQIDIHLSKEFITEWLKE